MKKLFIILALLLLFSLGLKAQNFVEEVSESKAKISDKFKVKLDKLKKNDNFESIHFVNFNELKRIQKDGRITLTLPKMKDPVELVTFRMEYKTDTDYNWYATTKDGFGSVIIMRKGDEYNGHFSFRGNNEYQIYNENGQHILVKMKYMKADYSECSSKPEKKSNIIEPPKSSSERTSECFNPIRVLILWTPNAADADVNINNTVNTCIAQFNNSIYRSNIYNVAAVLAGSQQINFAETNNIINDVGQLATNRPDVEALRDNTDADVVVLLTNGTQGNYDNDIRGRAYQFGLVRANAYAIVQVIPATGNPKTFSHEVGHLFDARHDGDYLDNALPYAHGYRIETGFFENTMCTLLYPDADDRIENFSNPHVSVSGYATGTSSTYDNARRIGETAPAVRNYEPNPNGNNLAASIYGPSHGYVNQSYTWEAATQCAQPPFNYEWLTSTDGFNWYYKGFGEFFTDDLPWSGNSYYYIWLKVSTPNGQISNSYLTVYTNYNGGARMAATDDSPALSAAPITWKTKSKEGTLEVDILTIENVFPNPIVSNFTLNFFNPETQNISLDIVDVSGKKSSIFSDEKTEVGKHSKQINLSKYPVGAYILKLSSEKQSVSSKIIVTQ
jgi:Secretion system C-terminal sorting domain/Metallo-peptidase family M12